jgi:hypothetical protein
MEPRAIRTTADTPVSLCWRLKEPATALFIGLFFATVALGQTPPQWHREQKTDPARGVSFTQFSLTGKFLTPPQNSSPTNPAMFIRCIPVSNHHGHTKGKFLEGYIWVGGHINYDVSETGTSFVPVEFRLDDGKLQSERWGRSADPSAVFFADPTCASCEKGYEVFANLLYGRREFRKQDANPQVRKIVIGVDELLGSEIVMQFDLPDATEVAEACGIIWHK